MLVTEIYNKLPKTNCGECGEATCIALALKVQTGQSKLSDCPYVEADVAGDEMSETVDDSYEVAAKKLEAEIKDADLASAAEGTGATYDAGKDVLALTMMGKRVEVRREGLFEEDEYCHDSWSRLIVYDYVLRQGGVAMSGEWMPFEHFPKTPSHVKSFQKRAEAELGRSYGENSEGLKKKIAELGGTPERDDGSDLAFRMHLLPRFPVLIRFWGADEDFAASSKISVDSSALEYLDIEYVARLIAKCVSLLVGHPVS